MFRCRAGIRSFGVRFHHASAIDASKLEFTRRNKAIEKNLSKFYPSLSTIPNRHDVITIEQFHERFGDFGAEDPSSVFHVNGRIKNIRFSGKKICFIDLYNNQSSKSLQLILNFNKLSLQNDKEPENVFETHLKFLKIGDYIQGIGYPGLSQRQRTLSLKCISLPRILSCAQLPLPPKLSDASKIKQNRVVDYQVNHDSINTLILRQSIINSIRSFLNGNDFVEVETPILTSKSNGAAAEAFTTLSNALPKGSNGLELRVAPELWLKRLIIAGFQKIYEIGKVFRNEGVDSIHNPEFTTLEFYQSFTSMEQLITLTEALFKRILMDLSKIQSNATIQDLIGRLEESNWKFARLEFLTTLSHELNQDLSQLDLNDPAALYKIVPSDLQLPDDLSPQQILNKLSAIYIEQRHCNNLLPTIVYHHPTVMSPLAKTNPENPLVTKRFEVFINGKEYINAYEEENCPQFQLSKFEQQQRSSQLYDDKESLSIDHKYIDAMKWGMPPIGGFGLGIDRLCMLLLKKQRIEEVLAFGCLDDVNRQ